MDTYVQTNFSDKEVKDINAKDFKIGDMKFRNNKLKKLPEAVKRKRIEMLLQFNQIFMQIINFICQSKEPGGLAQSFMAAKDMVLSSIKNKYIKSQIDSLPVGERADVEVARRKAQRAIERNVIDHKGEYSVFG